MREEGGGKREEGGKGIEKEKSKRAAVSFLQAFGLYLLTPVT